MSFNGSGTYSLPSGNPVTSGTTITSSWANTTLSDIASALSLTFIRDGRVPMQGALLLEDGSQSAPGIAFNSEANSGVYRVSAGELGVSVTGVLAGYFSTAGFTTTLKLSTGTFAASSNATVGGTLGVTGTTTLGTANISTLTVSGTSTLTGNSSVNGTLGVTGAATLSSSLSVATTTTLTGAVSCGSTLSASSTISAPTFNTTSDLRLKKDISPIKNALSKIECLNGVSFRFKDSNALSLGFLAQEVRKVFPEVVSEVDGHLTVAYGNLVGVLVEAIKELKARVDDMESRYGIGL